MALNFIIQGAVHKNISLTWAHEYRSINKVIIVPYISTKSRIHILFIYLLHTSVFMGLFTIRDAR